MNNRNLFTELEKLLRMDSTYCTEDGTLLKNTYSVFTTDCYSISCM